MSRVNARTTRAISIILAIILLAAGIVWLQSREASAGPPEASLIPLLTESGVVGFAQATQPGQIQFPRDLGSHDDYQTEWWYYTGNLETNDGRPFGFQLTFFRRALSPPSEEDCNSSVGQDCGVGSAWRSNQVYLAHFTVSDLAEERFYEHERFSRGAAGLAGAQAVPYRVWLEDWQAEAQPDGRVRLQAQSDETALDLLLTETLPPILHGDRGLSPKGPEPGNASYYYTILQQQAAGSIEVEGQRFDVTGLAWKDHEYSTSALSDEAVGWDWFSIQLDDGSSLMLFQIRESDGGINPLSSGTFIQSNGRTRTLSHTEWDLEVTGTWTSPESGGVYPAGWRISIPELNLVLTGRPLAADQELNVSTIYWEGATAFEGVLDGQPISGRGYVELTGYVESMTGRL